MPVRSIPLPVEVCKMIDQCHSPKGIVELGKSMNLTISKDFYHSFFPDDTHFQNYDYKMFEERAKSHLVVFKEDQSKRKDGFNEYPAVSYDIGDESIAQTTLSLEDEDLSHMHGQNVHILTTGGRIFFGDTFCKGRAEFERVRARETTLCKKDTEVFVENKEAVERRRVQRAEYWNKKDEYMRQMTIYQAGRQKERPEFQIQREYEDFRQPPLPDPRVRMFTEIVCNWPYKPTKFVQLTSEPDSFAVDDAGMLWVLPQNANHTLAAPICVTFNGNPVGGISKVRSTTEYFTCLVEGLGIVSINYNPECNPAELDGSKNGFACCQGNFFKVDIKPVVGTNGPILDHIIFKDYALFLTPQGLLCAVPLDNARENFARNIGNINNSGPFVQIVGDSKRVALLSSSGEVVVLIIQKNILVAAPEMDFGNLDVASIGLTAYNIVTLTEDGKVYYAKFEWKCRECQRNLYQWKSDHQHRHSYDEFDYTPNSDSSDSPETPESVEFSFEDHRYHKSPDVNDDILAVEGFQQLKLPGKAYSILGRGSGMAVLVYESQQEHVRKRKRVN